MADDATRIMALEAALEDAKRSLVAHDFLLRALLTHLALSEPESFEGVIGGFTKSGLYRSHGPAGELTREVAWELTAMLEDVAAGVRRR